MDSKVCEYTFMRYVVMFDDIKGRKMYNNCCLKNNNRREIYGLR